MKKSLLFLLGALVLLLAVFGIQKYREGAPRRDGLVFENTNVTDITHINIGYLRDSAELIKVDGRWLTTGDSFPVDTIRLQKVLGSLLGLQMREKVSDAPDAQSLWDYGLDAENARRVSWNAASGETVHVLLGKTSTLDYSFVYWKWRDRPEVYRTPGNFIWEVSPRVTEWKEKALWPPFTPADVRAVAVDWRDPEGAPRHYKIEKRSPAKTSPDDAYAIVEPFTAPVSRTEAEKLFEKASEFVVDDFGLELDPNRVSASQATVMSPSVVVRIELKDGTTRTLKGGETFEQMQYTQHPHHRNLVWVFKWRYDYFKKNPDELMAR